MQSDTNQESVTPKGNKKLPASNQQSKVRKPTRTPPTLRLLRQTLAGVETTYLFMNMVTLGVGGIPKVSRGAAALGVPPARARAADAMAAGVGQAVTLASVHSVQSSPMGSDRIEDVTGLADEDAQLEQQAAAFAAQFMSSAAFCTDACTVCKSTGGVATTSGDS